MDWINEKILQELTNSQMSQLVVGGFLDGLRPVERITVPEWSDKYRYLSRVATREYGQYRTDRTPYLKKIMECLSIYSPYEKIIFIKANQIGASEAACNMVGYCIHIAPAPTLYVMPTGDMVDVLSKTRIDTMIEASPELRKRIPIGNYKDRNNTIKLKTFPGGVLRLTGANSAAGLRTTPMKNLILDEPDAYPHDIDGEGDPVSIAIARTDTYEGGGRKIFILSTPTLSGYSIIEREFFGRIGDDGSIVGGTDRNYYHLPCPHCGEKQKLIFENLKWIAGKPETAIYVCMHCGCSIEERHKVDILLEQNGAIWLPDCPEKVNDKTIGFHLNGLYSPWKTWETIATQFEQAKNIPTKLQVFVNTVLAETWALRGESPEFKNLYNRRETYEVNTINEDVCFLSSGVDVQKDRVELIIIGWCSDKRSYVVDYRVIQGDTATVEVWDKLAMVLDETWLRGHAELKISLMAVDSGYNTNHVYAFARRYGYDRVIPIKGYEHLGMIYAPPKTVDMTKSGKKVGKVRLYSVGSNFLKTELYTWLRLEKDEHGVPPPCYCHFPQFDEHFFKSLTAEEQVKKIVRGFPKYEWVKKYDRNEVLDAWCYSRVAASVIGLDRYSSEQLKMIGGMGEPKKVIKPKKAPEIIAEPRRKERAESIWD